MKRIAIWIFATFLCGCYLEINAVSSIWNGGQKYFSNERANTPNDNLLKKMGLPRALRERAAAKMNSKRETAGLDFISFLSSAYSPGTLPNLAVLLLIWSLCNGSLRNDASFLLRYGTFLIISARRSLSSDPSMVNLVYGMGISMIERAGELGRPQSADFLGALTQKILNRNKLQDLLETEFRLSHIIVDSKNMANRAISILFSPGNLDFRSQMPVSAMINKTVVRNPPQQRKGASVEERMIKEGMDFFIKNFM